MTDLSILVVTKMEPHALAFLAQLSSVAWNSDRNAEYVIVADGDEAYDRLDDYNTGSHRYGGPCGWGAQCPTIHKVKSAGYIESVLDEAISFCQTPDDGYVLRLDDDEIPSHAMTRWLQNGSYRTSNHWKFPRVHLFRDAGHALVTGQLWPDHQTRLSTKRLAGGRPAIHGGSPHGGGIEAPFAIEHHKFLVKSLEERREIIARYDRIQPEAGSRFRAYSCPEDFYSTEEIDASLRVWDGETFHREAA